MNYYNKMMELINDLNGIKPKLLLHSCCAPCSSSVIDTLKDYFEITILYYNPNIEPESEYKVRKAEQIRFIKELDCSINFLDVDYENEKFRDISKGLEQECEGGARCSRCYHLRLEKTAKLAKENSFQYFGTTLSVSPYKSSERLNKIGESLSSIYQIQYLYSDFKKHDGYKKSIELAKKYNLYRQDYCGCSFSKLERDNKLKMASIQK